MSNTKQEKETRYQRRKEYLKEYQRKWDLRNKEKRSLWAKQYREKNRDALRLKVAKYYQEHREELLAKNNKVNKIRVAEMRALVIKKYESKCKKCGFKDIRALQIDHIHGNGSTERRKIARTSFYKKVLADVDNNYQLLCANCNWIKKVENQEVHLRLRHENNIINQE